MIRKKVSQFRWLSKRLGVSSALSFMHLEFINSKELLSVSINDSLKLFIRPNTTDILMASDVIYDREYDFSLKKEPNLIVDAGANIGAASIFFRMKYPDAELVSIEPDARNFEVLAMNLNNDDLSTPIRAALWNQSTHLSLDYSIAAECAVMTKDNGYETDQKKMIETITIPEIIQRFGPIDILKIDIEGAEKHLFDESANDWLKSVNVIMIELHDRYVPGCSRRFFKSIDEFPLEDVKGENFCAARHGWLSSPI